jgi:hypothetical protein
MGRVRPDGLAETPVRKGFVHAIATIAMAAARVPAKLQQNCSQYADAIPGRLLPKYDEMITELRARIPPCATEPDVLEIKLIYSFVYTLPICGCCKRQTRTVHNA